MEFLWLLLPVKGTHRVVRIAIAVVERLKPKS